MLWEFHLRGGAAVLIVVEFQSDIDHTMPLRLLQYTGSAWLEWARVRGAKVADRIPLVMPVLIYGGRARWTPPTRLERSSRPLHGGLRSAPLRIPVVGGAARGNGESAG